MNESKFKHYFLGDFTADQRSIDLHDRLAKYYRDTPDSMDNREAMMHWREFARWCKNRGYSLEEVHRAKKNVASSGVENVRD